MIGQFKDTLQSDWLESVGNQECTGLQRVAALSGLMALFGSEISSLHVTVLLKLVDENYYE